MAGTLYSFNTFTPWIETLDLVPTWGYFQRLPRRAVAQGPWHAPLVSMSRDIDLVDETFIAADPARVAAAVADPAHWRIWWPDLTLTVFMDRGLAGIRWSATGALVGSVEIWLEPMADGVLLHHYVRADLPGFGRPGTARPTGSGRRARVTAARLRRRRAQAWKRHVWRLKDALEADRVVGERVPVGEPVPVGGGL